jgi:hypothetical protein
VSVGCRLGGGGGDGGGGSLRHLAASLVNHPALPASPHGPAPRAVNRVVRSNTANRARRAYDSTLRAAYPDGPALLAGLLKRDPLVVGELAKASREIDPEFCNAGVKEFMSTRRPLALLAMLLLATFGATSRVRTSKAAEPAKSTAPQVQHPVLRHQQAGRRDRRHGDGRVPSAQR